MNMKFTFLCIYYVTKYMEILKFTLFSRMLCFSFFHLYIYKFYSTPLNIINSLHLSLFCFLSTIICMHAQQMILLMFVLHFQRFLCFIFRINLKLKKHIFISMLFLFSLLCYYDDELYTFFWPYDFYTYLHDSHEISKSAET